MPDNDIYNNKERYERFITRINELATPLVRQSTHQVRGKSFYVCKNACNLKYFHELVTYFAARDTSYVRRLRVLRTLKLVCHATQKDLAACDQKDMNVIVAFAHTRLHSPKSKVDFLRDVKFMWRRLFPEADAKGRPDETITPYAVRHLAARTDVSREKLREDRLTIEEIQALLKAFSQDARMLAYIAVALDTLGRPQEILYRRIKNIELYDAYAKIWVSDHGKEGPKFLTAIDSYPYLARWLNQHPLRHDPEAFLFLNTGNTGRHEQLKPHTINMHLREKLKLLGIKKPITCYSLKRNGVTLRLQRGESYEEIRHVAGMRSIQHLKHYDLTTPTDILNRQLADRGLAKATTPAASRISKTCLLCHHTNDLTTEVCTNCKRPLDREKIKQLIKQSTAIDLSATKENDALRTELDALKEQFAEINTFMNRATQNKPELIRQIAEAAHTKNTDHANGIKPG